MSEQKRIQSMLLDMLKQFHKFCNDKNLRYYIIEGTMLGAYRHKGFIPWDDDIDIGMPRDDFEELKKYSNINDRYIFENIESQDKHYLFVISKLYDTSTTLIENTRYRLNRGIYIDIFPIDGLGDNYGNAVKHVNKIERYKLLLKLRNSPDKSNRSSAKNIVIDLVRKSPGQIADEKKLCFHIDELCKKYKLENSVYAGNVLGAYGTKEIVKKDLFGIPQLYLFEDTYVWGVQKPEEYLTCLYGDWRQLPPIEKRVTHHDYFLDLDNSYLNNRTTL